MKGRDLPSAYGFQDAEAVRRQVRARRAETRIKLISVEIDDKPQVVREIVEVFYEEILALVRTGFPLNLNAVEYALEKVRIIYASRRDVAQDEISQGLDLSLQLFKAFFGGSSHIWSPSDRSVGELRHLRLHIHALRTRRRLTAPFKRHQPMNIPPSTIDKIRLALGQDVSVAHICLMAFAVLGISVGLLALLAAGSGQ